MKDKILMVVFILVLGSFWTTALVVVDSYTKPRIEKYAAEKLRKSILGAFDIPYEGKDIGALFKENIEVMEREGKTVYRIREEGAVAFKIAGSLAFKKASEQANPVLLEPIMDVTITTPDEYMGDIMGDLNGRRGRVLGMDSAGKNQVINAQVPMAEFLTYAPDLRSMTGGRGIYTMKFSHYDEVPAQISEKIVEEIVKNKE